MQPQRLLRQLLAFSPYFTPNSTVSRQTTLSLAPKMPRAPVLCISHGGGPLPVLGDPNHASIISSLRTRAPRILSLSDPTSRPRAILLVTAHWQTPTTTLSSGAHPSLIYDYGGFPPEAYALEYPAPGAPDIAAEVHGFLVAEGLSARLDPVRGWDHGVFVPMMLVRPEADVPIVQMSILASQDAAAHLRIGRVLGRIRDANIAIVGSGFASFHNLRHMFAIMRGPGGGGDAGARARVVRWNEELVEVLKMGAPQRDEKLARWRDIEGAYDAHPDGGADHFMPLLVCAGASAPEEEVRMYKDEFLGVPIWSFYWGADQVD